MACRARRRARAASGQARRQRSGSRATRRSSRSRTGISRVAGLVREIVAASFFGTSGPGLGVHDRLPGPEPGRATCSRTRRCRRRSCRCSPTCCSRARKRGVPAGLDAVLDHADRAGRDHRVLHPRRRRDHAAVHGPDVQRADSTTLTVGLSQVLFPVVLLLGLTGLLVGILQSYDHFTIPAISPAVWNVVIIVLLVVLRPHFHGGRRRQQIYALRDRDPGRDVRAAADGVRRRSGGSTSACSSTSTGTTRASARCSC